MTPAVLVFSNAMPRATRRLIVGLAVSFVLHLLLVLGFAPQATRYVPPVPLQVELRREAAPDSTAEIASEPPAELTAKPIAVAPTPVPPREEQLPAPAAPKAPVDVKLPLDKYFTFREVDIRAEQLNQVDLVYPERAYQWRIKGTVVLRIFINQHGAIDDVSILEATPPGVFEEAALTATRALQFKPAIKNGRNVKSQKTIEVVFDPYERINIP